MNTQPRPISERMLTVQGMTDLTHAERTLLSVIAYHDGPGGAFPAIATLAEHCGISMSWTKELLQNIKLKGRLSWRRRRRATSVFTINYDAPILEVRELQTLRIPLRSQGITPVRSPGIPATNRKETEEALSMKTNTKPTIGFCRGCGIFLAAGQEFCVACGLEEKPFFMTADERARGELELPFGLVVSGLDTPAGRQLFMSDEGQAALQEAYRTIFADDSVIH